MKGPWYALSLLPLLVLAGCATASPDFTLTSTPATLTLQNEGVSSSLTFTAVASNGFSDPVQVTLSGLPSGVNVASSTVTINPGQLGQFTLAASGATVGSAGNLTLTASSGGLTHTSTAALNITAGVANAALSGSTFSFGSDTVNNPVTQSAVTVTNIGSAELYLNPALTGDPSFTLVPAQSCGTSLDPGASCNVLVQYLPTAVSSGQSTSLNLGFTDVPVGTPQLVAITGSAVLAPDFTLSAVPNTVEIQNDGVSRPLTFTAVASNGYSAPITVSFSNLPPGVTASPTSVTITPGQLGQVQLTAANAAVTTSTIDINGISGSLTHTTMAGLTVTSAVTSAALSDTTFDFGQNTINTTVTHSVVTVTNTGSSVLLLNPILSGDPSFSIVTARSCGLSLAVGANCSVIVSYLPTAVSSGQSTTLSLGFGDVASGTPQLVTITGSAVQPDFTLSAVPDTVSIRDNGSSRPLTFTANATNGFNSPVTVSFSNLPAGVTASPTSVTINPGQLGQVQITAANAAVATTTITLTGAAGSLTHTTTAGVTVTPAITTTALSNITYDFGQNLVNNTLTQSVVTVTNTGASDLQLNPTLTGDPSFSIVAAQSCGLVLSAGASCSVVLNYDPSTASAPSQQTTQLSLGFGDVAAGTPQTVTVTGTSSSLTPGVVTPTENPQVALYTMTLPFPGSITVNFGTDTTYGRSTWSQSTTVAGGQVSIYVAGMLANTTYHMQAAVQFTNGITTNDIDQTFTTGASPITNNLTVTTTPGFTPQSGLEEVTIVTGTPRLFVTDLAGNTLWSYVLPGDSVDSIDGVKLLPNGHFLITIGQAPSAPVTGTTSGPTLTLVNAVREIDLAGNTIRELGINDLNDELKNAGYNIILDQIHHDILPLPNGHWLVLANTYETGSDAAALADVLIDVDQNLNPVWVWNAMDYLDLDRRPMGFPDWTHGNAVIYSPTDHNLIFSMRHQNWVIKINYQDGTGDGSILWRLGEGGDFTLVNGTDPTDWNYAQHYPSLVDPNNSAGIFSMILMDNGNDRQFPSGSVLCSVGGPSCYSTIPIFQINESAKTATITFHQIIPPNLFNIFGGNAEVLSNGDIEYDLCGVGFDSYVYEITPNQDQVWSMQITSGNAYRAFRIPSLYPGVQW